MATNARNYKTRYGAQYADMARTLTASAADRATERPMWSRQEGGGADSVL